MSSVHEIWTVDTVNDLDELCHNGQTKDIEQSHVGVRSHLLNPTGVAFEPGLNKSLGNFYCTKQRL